MTYTNYENAPLPASRFPYLLALYWDDLSPAQSGSVRRYDDPAQRFTCITWFNVVRFNTHETLSAQILLYADGDIRMNVLRAPQTKNSSTVGIQGQYGSNDHYLQYGCDGNPGEHQPEDSTSIRFYVRRLGHDVGVFHGGMPCGWIPTGSQTPVTGVFKNYGLSTETFPVSCCVIRTRVPRDTVFTRTQTVSNLAPGDTVECYFGDWLVPPTPDSWEFRGHNKRLLTPCGRLGTVVYGTMGSVGCAVGSSSRHAAGNPAPACVLPRRGLPDLPAADAGLV